MCVRFGFSVDAKWKTGFKKNRASKHFDIGG